MLSFCLKCRKNAESKNPKVGKRKNKIFIKIYSVYSKKSRFIKEEEASGLLSIKRI